MEPLLIFDVGMHIGQDTEFYIKKGFRVVAIEANPVLVAAARDKFSNDIASGQLVIEGVGIGPSEGTMPFYVNRSLTEWSSFVEHIGIRGSGADVIEVPVVRLKNILDKYGIPYYLKIDIEGYDIHAITSLWAFEDRPAYVSFEAVPNNLDGAATLFAQGYTQMKFIDQRLMPTLELRPPALEGHYVKHKFQLGSTGPFGEETPHKWGTFAEVATDYVKCMKFDLGNPRIEDTWWDFHCKNTRQIRK